MRGGAFSGQVAKLARTRHSHPINCENRPFVLGVMPFSTT